MLDYVNVRIWFLIRISLVLWPSEHRPQFLIPIKYTYIGLG